MTDDFQLSIRGIQEAQQKNIKRISAMSPRGGMGQVIHMVALALHRYSVQITHVDTGALRASHRIDEKAGKTNKARIFIDPMSVNPKGARPHRYGPVEHARGGSHAFYSRTKREASGPVIRRVLAWFKRKFRGR